MKRIKAPGFSFHSEPFWIWMCSLFPALVGILIAIFLVLLRKFMV